MSYVTEPCDRCGSKRLVKKSHTEILETYSGPQKIVVSEIICTNKVCQDKQNEENAASKRQNDERREKKELQEKERKNNINLSRRKAAGIN